MLIMCINNILQFNIKGIAFGLVAVEPKLYSSDSSSNPFSSPLTYSPFAPWIGQHTRLQDKLPYSKVFKGLSQSSVCCKSQDIDEDQILQILDSKSVNIYTCNLTVFV